jgi:inosine-uridine nucleoside N-ribohydrolase
MTNKSASHRPTAWLFQLLAACLCTGVMAADNYVIFEDDFDSDSDGPMALCMLLELEAAGECKIIACGTSELHEDSTATMAATLHYFGRGDIPLGSYRDDLWPYDPAHTQLYDESLFCKYMAADTFNYGHTRRHRRDYPDAIEVYAKALDALPPGAKAKIIIAGGQTNLRTLLHQHPQLVRDRVSELHIMGGQINPDDPEEKWQMDSNVSNTDPFAAKYVAENWPTDIPVYIADTYLALGVPFCRPAIRAQLSDLHPANRIHLLYRLWWDRGHGNALDLMSVITAVRGFTNLNGVDIIKVRGTFEINDDSSSPHYGRHRFISSPDGPHTLLRRVRDAATTGKLADYIDDILLLRGGDAGDGVFRDEFVVPMGDASETLQTRRGWTKAGAGDSNTLIEAGAKFNESSRYVQFNGSSKTSPYNVQVKDFGSKNVRVRARVMATRSGGYVGLCVRSDGGGANALGLNLRIQPGSLSQRPQPGSSGLRLYNNDAPLSQNRTYGPATVFAINTWYTLDLQAEGNQLIGRLYDDDDNRTIIEQVEFRLSSVGDRRWAGMIASDKGERANWFQSGVRASARRNSVSNGASGKEGK